MNIDLNLIARDIAVMDNPFARNEDIIAAKTMLACFGKRLRESGVEEALSIIAAVWGRAGLRSNEYRKPTKKKL